MKNILLIFIVLSFSFCSKKDEIVPASQGSQKGRFKQNYISQPHVIIKNSAGISDTFGLTMSHKTVESYKNISDTIRWTAFLIDPDAGNMILYPSIYLSIYKIEKLDGHVILSNDSLGSDQKYASFHKEGMSYSLRYNRGINIDFSDEKYIMAENIGFVPSQIIKYVGDASSLGHHASLISDTSNQINLSFYIKF